MEKATERRRDKRDVLELEKGLKPRVISRSATPQSVVTDRSLSSVDEEEEEGMPRNCVPRGSCGTTGRCTAVSDSDGAVCEEEEDVEDEDARTEGAGEAEGEMPPAVAAQREFLARLEEKELRRQCCRRCLPACCMPCCKQRCGCCLSCCTCPTCPSRKQCWNPCNYSGYFYAALVFACAVCGAVFVACGALQNNRQFLIAGSILCITSFGLFLHRCFRKSPYQPKGYPGFLDDEDFSSGGSGDYEPPPPPPLPAPVIVTETEVGKTSTIASTPPDYPAATSDGATLQVPCNNANGRRPSTGYDPARRRATVYDVSQRRRSSVYYDGSRRRSSTSIAHGLGSVSGDPMRGPYGRRGRAGGGSGILDLARRLSVAGGPGHGFNDGWNTSGSRLQHHYRRSCSYPWAMARPEHHYVEYV